jgi:hypothetical protein
MKGVWRFIVDFFTLGPPDHVIYPWSLTTSEERREEARLRKLEREG